MSKNFERIRSCVEVPNYAHLRDLNLVEEHIKKQLAHNIAEYILKEFNNLPLTMTSVENVEKNSKIYMLDLNLISPKHYRELNDEVNAAKIYKNFLVNAWRSMLND